MEGREATCCFTGHRPAKLPWRLDEEDPRCAALKTRLWDALAAAYDTGMRHFICGMALGCDLYFAEAVLRLKTLHPDATLEAAIPCATQADGWGRELRARYDAILAACDLETLVQRRYTPSCMQRRDRYMVDRSSLLIAVYGGQPGGTQYTVQYAMGKGVSIVDIPPVLEKG